MLLALAAQRGHARAEALLSSIRKPLPGDLDGHLPPCLYAADALPPGEGEAVVSHEVVEHYIAGLPRNHRAPRVRQLRAQVLVFSRAHFQKCHYNSANCSGAAGFPIPKA